MYITRWSFIGLLSVYESNHLFHPPPRQSAGELENDEHTAAVMMQMVRTASRFRLPGSAEPPFKRMSGDSHARTRTLSIVQVGVSPGLTCGLVSPQWSWRTSFTLWRFLVRKCLWWNVRTTSRNQSAFRGVSSGSEVAVRWSAAGRCFCLNVSASWLKINVLSLLISLSRAHLVLKQPIINKVMSGLINESWKRKHSSSSDFRNSSHLEVKVPR